MPVPFAASVPKKSPCFNLEYLPTARPHAQIVFRRDSGLAGKTFMVINIRIRFLFILKRHQKPHIVH